MIYNYKESVELFGSHYALIAAVNNKKIFKIKNGLYSTSNEPSELEVFVKLHSGATFTMESALFYLGISDYVPDIFVVATSRNATKYSENNIKQYFIPDGLCGLGIEEIDYHGIKIKVFNKERMLVEVLRYKNKLPYDYYKEVINYYRNHLNDINISLVSEYIDLFPKKKLIESIFKNEVL